MKIHPIAKILPVVLLLSNLTACGTFQAIETPEEPLRVGYTQSWGDYTLLTAQDKGFFEKYDVPVEPIYYQVLSDAYPDLASGQIDCALISVEETININRNAPLKVVAVYDNGGRDAIIVGDNINSIQDLRGKTIGVTTGSQFELTVIKMLQSVNMSVGDVTIASMEPKDALSNLQQNQVQAAYTREPYLSESISNGYKVLYPNNEEQLLFPDMIVFRKSVVDKRPDDVRAFLKAWFQAVGYRLQHQGETRDIAAKYLGISPDQVKPDDGLKIFTVDDNKALFNVQKVNSIYNITKITSDYLISIGVIVENIDLLELLDPSYLP
jgi:NitT/TauT family transport system substrate-binding protein